MSTRKSSRGQLLHKLKDKERSQLYSVGSFTARVRCTTGGYVCEFTGVCLFRGWGLPHLHPIISPSCNTSTGPMSFLWGGCTPSPSYNTSTGPMSFLWGYPSPRWGHTPARSGWGTVNQNHLAGPNPCLTTNHSFTVVILQCHR